MREIPIIESELIQRRAEFDATRSEASRLLAKQAGLEESIKTLEAELKAAKEGDIWQYKQYLRNNERVLPTPGHGMVGWLAWWSGLVYTHWGALTCAEAVRRGVLTMQVDWEPGSGKQANFGALEASKKLAEQYGFLLVIRPGYIWPTNAFDPKTDYVDPPIELVKGHIAQFADWCKLNRHVLAYVMIGFWGRWAEGNGSNQSNNPTYYLDIIRTADTLLPRGLWKLTRRPDILAAVFGTPGAATAAWWGIKNMAFAHKWWDAGTDNQGQFAKNPIAGRNWRLALRGGPSALECMGPTGQDFDEARDTWPELEAELHRVSATGFHLWSPGKDFQRLGGIEWMAKYGGARFELTGVELPTSVNPGPNRVKLTVYNGGSGYYYRDLWPSLTLEQGDKQWAAGLDGFNLASIAPKSERMLECTWYVPNLAPGYYSLYLGFYPGAEAKKHPAWRLQQLRFANLDPGGDGGNALGLEVMLR